MSHDRRTFIRTVGAGSIGMLAGCSGSDEPEDTTADSTGTTSSPDGSTTASGGTTSSDVPTVITMKAAGADIWNASDLGHFYYAKVNGDFDVRVQVASLQNTNPHAKAGIMARGSLKPDAKNVMARSRAGFGISPQWRPEDGAQTTSTTSEGGRELSRVEGGTMEGDWLRLQRSSGIVRAYGSKNGEDWTLMTELPPNVMELPDEVFLGLAATSHSSGQAATVKFRNLTGVQPTKNSDIGEPAISGSVEEAQTAITSNAEPANLKPNAATLQATVESLGGLDSVEARFEYRRATEEEWQQTETKEVSSTGTFGIDVSGLTPRRYYYFRTVTDSGENVSTTVATLFSTPSGSSGSSKTGPRSASSFDPDDGFADVAPWVTDDTPVVKVTEPTREALEKATSIPGPRIVVFETSGTIDLKAKSLNVRNDKCWIAGQTAPSPGITLVRGDVWLYGDDCVMQHVRVRPGTAGQSKGWAPGGIDTADGSKNNVIDHCTTTWAIDENLSAGYETENTTISNCLVAEPLDDATHPKGPHGYGSLVGNNAKNVTLVGNVWAFNVDRNPRVKKGVRAVIANNFVHHFSDGIWIDPNTKTSIVGNEFELPQTDQPNVFGQGTSFVEDNVLDSEEADNPMVGDSVEQVDSRPLWPEALKTIATGEVQKHNLQNAGARPADRTENDKRILRQIRNGTGGVIDHQDEVGGYPNLSVNEQTLDIPTTGLRAWLRKKAVDVEQ